MTSSRRTPETILGMRPMGFVLVILIITSFAGWATAYAIATRDRDEARAQVTEVADDAQQLADCVRDPATTASECKDQADVVEETIDNNGVGPTGAQGVQGPIGPTGVQGPQGAQGPTGATGPAGPRGERGFIGPIGPAGVPGDDGTAGDQGTTGATGAAGPPGPAGEPGEPGQDGADGQPGPEGPPGPVGPQGTAQPGTYGCPPDEYVTGFDVDQDGAVTVHCAPAALLP